MAGLLRSVNFYSDTLFIENTVSFQNFLVAVLSGITTNTRALLVAAISSFIPVTGATSVNIILDTQTRFLGGTLVTALVTVVNRGSNLTIVATRNSDNVLSFETDQFNIQHGNHSPFLSDMYAAINRGIP
jgi:hypothetical protein